MSGVEGLFISEAGTFKWFTRDFITEGSIPNLLNGSGETNANEILRCKSGAIERFD